MKIPHLHSPDAMRVLRDGRILVEGETPEMMMARVFDAVLGAERSFGTPTPEIKSLRREIERYVAERIVIFGTPLLTNAGRNTAALSSCIAAPVDFTSPMERSLPVIEALYRQNMGSGYNLNPSPDPVAAVMKLNEHARRVVSAAMCERYIGNMAHVDIDHPKIVDFATLKSKRSDIVHLNLSVNTSSEFMAARETGSVFPLRDGTRIDARVLWRFIVESAWACGDPGLLFLDRFNADNPTPALGTYSTTAPCAEVGLAPGEACVFGYVNVAALPLLGGAARFDFARLRRITAVLIRVLDDALEASLPNYAAPQSRIVMGGKRKIGIGICGYADLLVQLGLPYGSERAVRLLRDILLTITHGSKRGSVELAAARESFPAFRHSRFGAGGFLNAKYGLIESDVISAADWNELDQLILKHGIRNASTTALPPSGRSARLLGTSSSIEPWFSLIEADKEPKAELVSALKRAGLGADQREIVLAGVRATGTCQNLRQLKPDLRSMLRRAIEIPASEHLRIAAEASGCVDEGVSKTINLPANATPDDVSFAYREAWRLGMKAISVYRDGSRENQPEGLSG